MYIVSNSETKLLKMKTTEEKKMNTLKKQLELLIIERKETGKRWAFQNAWQPERAELQEKMNKLDKQITDMQALSVKTVRTVKAVKAVKAVKLIKTAKPLSLTLAGIHNKIVDINS